MVIVMMMIIVVMMTMAMIKTLVVWEMGQQ